MKSHQSKSHSVNDLKSAMEAFEQMLMDVRRKHPRRSPDYRAMTLHIQDVRSLQSLLEGGVLSTDTTSTPANVV